MKRYGEPIPSQHADAAPKEGRGQYVDVLFGGCGYGVGPLRRPAPPPKPSLLARLRAFLGLGRKEAPENHASR